MQIYIYKLNDAHKLFSKKVLLQFTKKYKYEIT